MREPAPPYLRRLGDFLARTRFEDLPDEVVRRTRWIIADSVAAIAGASNEAEVIALVDRLGGSRGPASVIGGRRSTSVDRAALVNGTAGTFLELDEGNQFARGHPGIHVVPLALAMAQAEGFSGREVIRAVALGYEVGARIGIATKLRMSMHPHGTWGTVGAAVTAGCLRRLDADAMVELINVSSSLGLTTSRNNMLVGGTIRNSYSGFSNMMGYMALEFRDAGFIAEPDGLRTVYGAVVSDSYQPEAMVEALGECWEVARNYFKRHACCRYNHAALDALARLSGERRLEADEIERVEVQTYSLAAQLSGQTPDNVLAAKFSVPFAVATALVRGHTGVLSFKQEAVLDADIRALALRVFVKEDPSLTALMPGKRAARVTVTLRDGSVLSAYTDVNRGDTEDPYGEADLEAKFMELTAVAWTPENQRALLSRMLTLDKAEDLSFLSAAEAGK